MLDYQAFEPLLGEEFSASAQDVAPFDLELIEAVERAGDDRLAPGFTLQFRTSAGQDVFTQQTYQVAHPVLGSHAIFLVPVGQDDHGRVSYEAVFTRT